MSQVCRVEKLPADVRSEIEMTLEVSVGEAAALLRWLERRRARRG